MRAIDKITGRDYEFEGITFIDGEEFLTFRFIDASDDDDVEDLKKVLLEVVSIVVLETNTGVSFISMGDTMHVRLIDSDYTTIGFLELSDGKFKMFLNKEKYILNDRNDRFDDVFSEISDIKMRF